MGKEIKELKFEEVLFNLNNLLFIKANLREYIKNKDTRFTTVKYDEALANMPKAIELIKKYYPIYKELFVLNKFIEELAVFIFQCLPTTDTVKLNFIQQLIDIAPTLDIVNSLFNQYNFETFDSEDRDSAYHIMHSHELIHFFIRNGVCAKYSLALGRTVAIFVDNNKASKASLEVFRSKLMFLLNNCRDVEGLPDFAKEVAIWSMLLNEHDTLKLALSFNPSFDKDDRAKIKRNHMNISEDTLEIYLAYSRSLED